MILFIDCYDSFSYNLTSLVEKACSRPIVVAHHDRLDRDQLCSLLPKLEAVIIGPGPGDPNNATDRGHIAELWELVKRTPIPVFGVCFGYQSMVLAFNGEVKRLETPKHGQVSKIRYTKNQLFAGIPNDFNAVRYHSLFVQAVSPLKNFAMSEDDGVQMACCHENLPLFGVQFHPESVLSQYGEQILRNFWNLASEFNDAHRVIEPGHVPRELTVTYEPLMKSGKPGGNQDVHVEIVSGDISWDLVSEVLDDFVLLKSASAPGNWSIFGILENDATTHIRSKGNKITEGPLRALPLIEKEGNIWSHLAEFMALRLLSPAKTESLRKFGLPFLGGIIGYVTYEGGCQYTVCDDIPLDSPASSDLSFVYVDKAVIISEDQKHCYTVGPENWARKMARTIETKSINRSPAPVVAQVPAPDVNVESSSTYESKVTKCFDYLKAGDSYELCLTTQAQLRFDSAPTPWDLFKLMVKHNPAPYCSYMAFDDYLVATSPERFMQWDENKCEFRPIKGTVKKSTLMTFEKASEILRTPKEQAENLMIVDLIRHDLGHLLEAVTTPQLMAVEEYHSVYQLVTSVEAEFKHNRTMRGIDVLSQSLPPGSMTGAPKKRSVDILRKLEESPRGLYSGVQGYWSIDDRGDWSVIIRSLFKYHSDPPGLWRIGAGGGVTILSTPEGEDEEMRTKLSSVLNTFSD